MTVDFINYKYDDGIVCKEKKTTTKRFGVGLRHVQLVYMCACTVVLYVLRGSASITVMAMTDVSHRNDTGIQTFDWNRKSQATIFFSFLFGYTLLLIPTEIFVKRFNGKYILFIVLLVNGFLCVIIPTVAIEGDWIAVSNTYLLMGMTQSCTLPAVRVLLSSWLPAHERRTCGACVYAGTILGIIVSMPLTSLFSESRLGWRMVYYAWAMLVLSMAVVWCFLTAASPAQHEAVGDEEKEYIEESLKNDQKKLQEVSWKQIVKGSSFWALVSAHVGYQVVYVLFLYTIPIYFDNLLNIPKEHIGWCSALPFVTMWSAHLMLSPHAAGGDTYSILTYIFNVAYYRKLLNTIGTFGVIIGLTLLSALSNEHRNLAVAIAVIAYGSTAFQFSGFLVNHADMAPHFSGTALFMTGFMANVVGAFVPLLVGTVLDLDMCLEGKWRIIFLSVATMCVICNVVYLWFGSSERLANIESVKTIGTSEENEFVLKQKAQTNIG